MLVTKKKSYRVTIVTDTSNPVYDYIVEENEIEAKTAAIRRFIIDRGVRATFDIIDVNVEENHE